MQKGIKRAVRVGGIYYRVYKHQGEIQVSRGVITATGNFEPFSQSSPWLTQNPEYTMTLEHGKILCENENDIPEAIEMVKRGKDVLKVEIKNKRTKNPTIEEAIELLKDGAHNHKDERYPIAYGMALGALKACGELLKKAGCDKSIDETYSELDGEVKKLLEDLALGKITISEYEEKVKELADKQNAVNYEFTTTETEFHVIRHGVNKVLSYLDYKLNPIKYKSYSAPLTIEERRAYEVERAAARELLYKLDAVLKGE